MLIEFDLVSFSVFLERKEGLFIPVTLFDFSAFNCDCSLREWDIVRHDD